MNGFKLNTQNDNIFIINLSEIEKRLDPNPYHIERLAEIEKLQKLDCKKLKSVVIPSKSQTGSIRENDIYIGLENIKSNTGEYIKTKEKESISSANIFKSGQILFPKLRPYLNKVFLAEFDGICSTEFHVFNAKNINAEYLAIYLRSSFVVNQTKHLMTGNTLPRLQTDDINNIPVPIISDELQQQIVNLYNEEFEKKQQKEKEAKDLLASIDGYLLDELCIELPEKDNSLENRIFTASISEISGGRFDPKLYDNFTSALRLSIKENKYKSDNLRLKDLLTQSFAGSWGEDELKFSEDENYKKCLVIRATEFDNKYNLDVDNSRVKYRLIPRKKLQTLDIQTNDLLIEKSGGSPDQPVGRISIVTEEMINNHSLCYSNFIHKIRIDTDICNPIYLFNYLKTVHNIKLTDAMQSQTNGIRNLIMSNYFNQTIPIPPKEKQTEIASHITDLRNQAKQLELDADQIMTEAKAEVENIILG
ncbi:restriction endonuclease subunit S [Tenacibaculum maritimum]|uniref:Type I restriction modification DNA specificity domain protein n=1 Tax=Tenacibaculum maritimum NCIMB 2154 TaxID=1349785 RepID=A0A2H1E8V9_9FLAO|nr:restriction endonuclease subunit S [Tenacibaculum maritimum]SFZ81056.1 Type I restriction modification DNA specificity domain protein [Tenacibaculum maritimum NCIMB 2154]